MKREANLENPCDPEEQVLVNSYIATGRSSHPLRTMTDIYFGGKRLYRRQFAKIIEKSDFHQVLFAPC